MFPPTRLRLRGTALEEVLSDLKRGQQAVHQWGAENRVSFDPGKEVFAVVHPRVAHGPNGKLLGAIVDKADHDILHRSHHAKSHA